MTTIEEAEKLHQAGQLLDAKALYLSLLKADPTDVRALHLLAILLAELGELTEAQAYLEQAIRIAPDNAVFYLHLANIYRAKNALPEARKILTTLTEKYPQFAAAFNNLGTIYYAEGAFKEAVSAYKRALDLQENYADAYYNLGLALTKLNHIDEALEVYQALLAISKEHAGALFQSARLWMLQKNYPKAIILFETLLKYHPYHFETQSNLATIYLARGNLKAAKKHYLLAYDIDQNDQQVLFNLGVINMQLGQIGEAIDFYSRLMTIAPLHFEAHNNLAFIYLSMQKKDLALAHYRKALSIDPKNEAIKHTIRILSGDKKINTSPIKYVENLFDSYADHFDAHLKNQLKYRVPEEMAALLSTVFPKEKGFNILDLGCGTGLSGIAFAPYAKTLTGVDISSKMLAQAEKKQVYTALYQSNILDFLQEKLNYDLIVACDVLVYFGDLAPFFNTLAQAMQPEQYFIFNTEINEEDDYSMTESGRFTHNAAYLDELLLSNHFKKVSYQTILMRVQNELPVYGHLYFVQKF